MNTHDIDLLKYGGNKNDDYVTGWNDCYAAIEADRKRRGEPTAAEISDVVREITGCPDIKSGEKSLVVALGMLFHSCAAPQPAEPVKLPSDDERAAQGLPPYNPRLPTDEEMKRLTENGRKAWGKDDTEPARVPSDDDLLALIREHAFRQYEFDDLLAFARDLLARYTTTKEQP